MSCSNCGVNERITFTNDCEIKSADAVVSANTGKSIIRITGVAFHDGINKNGWKITRKGAELTFNQMVGTDLTLNHPSAENGYFTRNMDGGVDEAVIGFITEANILDYDLGRFEVRFAAEVHRQELFEALESGLWLREGYGVSIGGSGIPDDIIEAEDGSFQMIFESDFKLDHLAVVHRPAYERAKIHSVEKLHESIATDEPLISHTDNAIVIQSGEITMSEEETIIEASEELVSEEIDYASEIEALKADLVLREAEIEAFKAAEDAKEEEIRQSFVSQASELGMKGHDDFSAETLETLIASWKDSHQEPEQPIVELTPVVSGASVETTPKVESPSKSVKANFLNQRLVETPTTVYEKGWNAWANAWNRTLAASEKDKMRAPLYNEVKEMI